ncbi:MAG TPA: tRNA uracil 4-sulfurtransferase ThiI [Candidatus Bathyarchaeia archaeon]|nr:tRNA uracil 4-sulfurtransferase ThiI [Candidatus Bathyarchaeia archaeon]
MTNEASELHNVDAVLVRYGEIGIKSDRVRSRYERTLVNNIRNVLDFRAIKYDAVVRDFGRIFVQTRDSRAAQVVARVFGVVSTSAVSTSAANLAAMSSAAVRIVSPLLADGQSFGIRARRTGSHDYSSKDIGEVVGGAIKNATGAPVQLSNPDVQLFIEVRANNAYLYTEVIPGVGGLPLGTQGKIVALISGGIDSPVAAWLMMKRGCTIVPVFFDCAPYIGDGAQRRAHAVVKALAAWAGRPLEFAVVHHGDSLAEFKKAAPRMTCVLCKRMMYRIATSVAKDKRAHGIATGESIGQVASQTTANLLAIDDAAAVPVFRPLIGFDKTESIKLARRIGTYRLSTAGDPLSCTAAHRHPTTNANKEELETHEAELLVDELSAKETHSIAWRQLPPDSSFQWELAADN